ncbi:MAG: hypothetical protein JSR62_11645 [Nitrospira sp.]|nr:hypothetical protein [Nitrospira sp.]
MNAWRFAAPACLLGLLCLAVTPGGISSSSAGLSSARTIADSAGTVANPHSDLIFRATGATTCLDCHRGGKNGVVSAQVQDNTLVQDLKAKAKGIHGPGRFADCLRCHAGGNKGVEKYRQ